MVTECGSRRWPRTLAGITAYQPCLQHPFAAGPAGVGSAGEKQAWRRCDRTGRWEDGDYSHCLYTNDITRVLYTFVLVSEGPGGLGWAAGAQLVTVVLPWPSSSIRPADAHQRLQRPDPGSPAPRLHGRGSQLLGHG